MLEFGGQKHVLRGKLLDVNTLSARLPKTIGSVYGVNEYKPNFVVLYFPSIDPECLTLSLIESTADYLKPISFRNPIPYICGNDTFEYQNGVYSLPSVLADSSALIGVTKGDVAVCGLVSSLSSELSSSVSSSVSSELFSELFITTPAIYLHTLQALKNCSVGDLRGLEAYVEMRNSFIFLPAE